MVLGMYRRDQRDASCDTLLSELAMVETGSSNSQALPDPTGEFIAYPSGREGRTDLWITDGTGPGTRLTSGDLILSPYPRYHVDARWMDWHPAEPRLAYAAVTAGSPDLWIADAETGEKSRVTTYEAADGDPAFSPDGSQLAYVTEHFGRSGLAIANADGDRIESLREDEYSYADPRWVDESTLLAVRTPDHDAYDYETELVRVSRNGDLEVVRRGKGTKVFAPRLRPGSDDVAFVDDSTGYEALYLLDSDGAVETLFAPDQLEVGAPSWNDDGTKLAVTVTGECQTQVWVVQVTGEAEQVSAVRGRHTMPTWLGDDVLSMVTAPTIPLDVRNVTSDETIRASTPVGFDNRLVEPDRLVYESDDGVEIQAMVYLPEEVPGGSDSIPLLVNPHQGPTLFDGFEFALGPQYFTALKYAVVQPNYRGSAGFGRTFRNRNDGAWGKGDLMDAVNAVDAVADEYAVVDGSRAGIFGSSLGGVMTVNALGKTDRFDVGAAFSGIYDYERFLDDTADSGTRLLTRELGLPSENVETYRELSPIRTATDIEVPLLVLHGQEDPMVDVNQSERLVEVLDAHDKTYEYRPYSDEGHSFVRRENVVDAYTRVADLFAKYL